MRLSRCSEQVKLLRGISFVPEVFRINIVVIIVNYIYKEGEVREVPIGDLHGIVFSQDGAVSILDDASVHHYLGIYL